MHPFDSFHDQKKWLKMHNNVFIEIQCKLIPFIRTLNLLWGRSINAKKKQQKWVWKKVRFIEWIVLPVAFLAKNFQRSDFMVVLQEQIYKTCRILLLHFASACVIINAHVIR